ncbi:substrate-binding domain-containing protein [Brachybacterium sp. GU-2]|uniref:substrate-binding domain-containing protein n=1 Tax=Brachybacterium sp. GU-2 TaxID=3069708 RepID=UPI00298BF113|nr:substrate-binding domain-containing protein [Brachybacterium sp. GU-2]WME23264.2 substrate-binding domain-containing protein [Brachybacterium sp. GU-2]
MQLATRVRDRALAHELSTLVLADERWYEYLLGAAADAALVTSIDFVPEGPEQMRRLARSTQTGLVAFSAQMEPEGFDVVSSSPLPAIGSAYARLRSRHERVHLLAPQIDRPGGVLAHQRTRAFLEAARAHGDDAAALVHVVPEGSHDTYRAALDWLAGSDRPCAVVCFTGYQAVALQLAAERAGLSVPDDLEFVAIGDIPTSSEFFGPISVHGVEDVFSRLAGILVDRAVDRIDRSGATHVFDWRFFPGTTTADDA